MSTISVRLPDSLHQLIREVSKADQVSMNQFIASAVAEKVSALTTERYLMERAQRGNEQKFRQALASVPDVEPEEFDRRNDSHGRASGS
ncbi:toxin-antitoxin system HicB family antitoxin [Magnetovirga frankeli]|uniref:DUF6290 family protein n=1 Tax=Magnetovirga frankeli TaxID=947516 RepID=UPI001293B20E|nr:toxin-antitoxin system HicB family antitoxin [gamma proteobacterium SS-5]